MATRPLRFSITWRAGCSKCYWLPLGRGAGCVMDAGFTCWGLGQSPVLVIDCIVNQNTQFSTKAFIFFCIEFFINLHCQTTVFLLFISFLHLLDCSLIFIPPHNVAISVSWEPCQWYRGWKSVGYSDHCSYRSFVTNAAIQTVWPPPRRWCVSPVTVTAPVCHQDISSAINGFLRNWEKKQALGKATIDKNLVATSICHNHILAIIILLEIQTKTVHLQFCPPPFTKENSIKQH